MRRAARPSCYQITMTAESMEPVPPSAMEEPDVTSYSQVKYKQNEGSLILTPKELSFRPTAGGPPANILWTTVSKHQVSPATHSKALLKLVLTDGKNSITYRLANRDELERIRKDVSARLQKLKSTANVPTPNLSGRRRSHAELSMPSTASFGEMDGTAQAVTRSALLASNPTLNAQHRYLVEETQTVTEDDFWKTHESLVEEEYAKICGTIRAGTSSLLQSHLPTQGRVTLGVEEMRQIFVLYPAVHKAYEEKVPLELSDEQFWRKYLESEFFHRDRGRLGTAGRNHGGAPSSDANGTKDASSSASSKRQQERQQEDARAAAVGTDDLFSRYDAKIRESEGQAASSSLASRKWGTHLAVGQFDLASTVNTERGHLLEGPRDEHPPNAADDGKGARVVQKYNRHWAMVLHPEEAVAGSDLAEVARRSVQEADQNDEYAKANGGVDEEMRRLVGYADAREADANHVLGTGVEDDDYEELTLSNIEAYFSAPDTKTSSNTEPAGEALNRNALFAKTMAAKMQTLARPYLAGGNGAGESSQESFFPPAELGRELLSALTKKMAADAQTEADTVALVNNLPEDFRKRLTSYFRRSSELLRHFFGLRKLDNHRNNQKLVRIVQGLEAVYREMESMRKDLPQTEMGEVMRKMCLPIMDQLDNAFRLHREGSGTGGGFVTVDDV